MWLLHLIQEPSEVLAIILVLIILKSPGKQSKCGESKSTTDSNKLTSQPSTVMMTIIELEGQLELGPEQLTDSAIS